MVLIYFLWQVTMVYALRGVHKEELMDDAEAYELPPRSPLTPVYGHLKGHYPLLARN